MDRRGRKTAVTVAVLLGCFIGGTVLWIGNGDGREVKLMAAASIFFAVSLPLGWHLGRKYDEVKRQAAEDGLTRVMNRGFVQRAFPLLINRAANKNKKMSISMIDINDFKLINDSCGHRAGDLVLLEIANSLRGCAGRGEMVARWGGDEFVVICPYGDERSNSAMQRMISDSLEQLSLKLGIRITASVGAAVFPDDGRTLDDLVQIADGRMYGEKDQRKSVYETKQMVQA
jgi:diguanylate cyclase (GGDEF)-like protein